MKYANIPFTRVKDVPCIARDTCLLSHDEVYQLIFARAELHSAFDQPGLNHPAQAGYPQLG